MKPEFFTVNDKGRQLDFEGYHLASSTSYAAGKPRWFVVDIYKTVGGKYIVAGSGKSNVVHRENWRRLASLLLWMFQNQKQCYCDYKN